MFHWHFFCSYECPQFYIITGAIDSDLSAMPIPVPRNVLLLSGFHMGFIMCYQGHVWQSFFLMLTYLLRYCIFMWVCLYPVYITKMSKSKEWLLNNSACFLSLLQIVVSWYRQYIPKPEPTAYLSSVFPRYWSHNFVIQIIDRRVLWIMKKSEEWEGFQTVLYVCSFIINSFESTLKTENNYIL